jgi:hypothetical protein
VTKSARRAGAGPLLRAALADVLAVVAFVGIGRSVHDVGVSLAGIAVTAWPFLGGLAIGWLVGRAWSRPGALWPAGIAAWLGASMVGMALRVLAGQGTALAFLGVTVAFLGAAMLGWRVVVLGATRRTRRDVVAGRS